MLNKINWKKKIDPNLITLIKVLKKNKIDYWICHGTLLGIIRDKELIHWDHDIDIGVVENKKKRSILRKILKKNGFKEIKKTFLKNDGMLKFIKNGGREIDVNFYRINEKKKTAYIVWHIPKNFIMKIIDALSFAKSYSGRGAKIIKFFSISQKFFLWVKKKLVLKGYFYSLAGYSHNKKYALITKKYKFSGLTIMIPKNSHQYLQDLYGKSWRTPIKKYNWIKDSPATTKIKNY